MVAAHPTSQKLEAYLTDAVPVAERDDLEAHLAGCRDCRTLLEATRAGREVTAPHRDSVRSTVRVPAILQLAGQASVATDPADVPRQAELGPGLLELEKTAPGQPALQAASKVSRYVLIDRVGRGAMGEVFVAYDPQLDRRVAIKVLRQEVAGQGGVYQARLLREAQAMARLTHPNVVAVHDAGVWGERVYLVMEYVEGPTLEAWAARRSWREVLAMYLAAGRGLAAAHAAALVHRDFKPQNVLVAPGGQPKVTDFGLAHVEGSSPAPPSAEAAARDVALTAEGAFIGTPAYMAPEQFLGKLADARSDQFSFCVSLYEALYGARPFEGEDVGSIAASLARGQPRPAPRGCPVPPWIFEVIARGLSRDPLARYPSLEHLLLALERDPTRRRRRLVQRALVGLGVVAVCGFAAWGVERNRTLCAREAEVAMPAFHLAAPDAALETTLQGYRARWVSRRREICEEVRSGTLSPETGALRLRCLGDQQLRVGAAVELLGVAGGVPADRLRSRLDGAWSSAACAHLESPRHAAQEERARFAGELSRIEALGESGSPERARAAAVELEARAAEAGARSAQAAALVTRAGLALLSGKNLEESAGLFHQAALLAEAAGDDQLAATARVDELKVLGLHLERREEAERLLPEVRAAIERAGSPPAESSTLYRVEGYLALLRKDRAATGFLERALASLREAYGPETPLAAAILSDLAEAQLRLERAPAAAAQAFLDAAALVRPVGLVEQSNLLILKVNAISALSLAAEPDRAEAVAREARPVAEAVAASAPLDACAYYLNVAEVELALGRAGDAQGDLDRAGKLLESADPSPDIQQSLAYLRARLALGRGDLTGARDFAQRAVQLADPEGGPDELALAQAVLGRALERSEPARARELARAAQQHFQQAPLPAFAEPAREVAALLQRLP